MPIHTTLTEGIKQAEKPAEDMPSATDRGAAPAADTHQHPQAASRADHTRETSTPIKKDQLMSHPHAKISSC